MTWKGAQKQIFLCKNESQERADLKHLCRPLSPPWPYTWNTGADLRSWSLSLCDKVFEAHTVAAEVRRVFPCSKAAITQEETEGFPAVLTSGKSFNTSKPQWTAKKLLCLLSRAIWEMHFLKGCGRASLVAQWLRVRLPLQGTRVRALVWEDPTCRGATRPVSHNYWACASGACAPQQERPR